MTIAKEVALEGGRMLPPQSTGGKIAARRKEGATVNQLAEEFDLTPGMVSYHLKRFGLVKRRPNTSERNARIVAAALAGKTNAEIAGVEGISRIRVQQILQTRLTTEQKQSRIHHRSLTPATPEGNENGSERDCIPSPPPPECDIA